MMLQCHWLVSLNVLELEGQIMSLVKVEVWIRDAVRLGLGVSWSSTNAWA